MQGYSLKGRDEFLIKLINRIVENSINEEEGVIGTQWENM